MPVRHLCGSVPEAARCVAQNLEQESKKKEVERDQQQRHRQYLLARLHQLTQGRYRQRASADNSPVSTVSTSSEQGQCCHHLLLLP